MTQHTPPGYVIGAVFGTPSGRAGGSTERTVGREGMHGPSEDAANTGEDSA